MRRRTFGLAAWPELQRIGGVDDLVLSDDDIIKLSRHVTDRPGGGDSPLASLLGACLVWRRGTNAVGKVIGGATANFVAYHLSKGKSESWIVKSYRAHVGRVLRAELNKQQAEFDSYFEELWELRQHRRR
jgi:hypothetical protein